MNPDGELEMFDRPNPPEHIPRYSNTTLSTALHLDHNTCERLLQKRIDELEEELRKEQAERAKAQAELEKAFTHAVCVGWEVKLLQEDAGEETEGTSHRSICDKRRRGPNIEGA